MRTPAYEYLGLDTVIKTEAYYYLDPKRVIYDLVLGTNPDNPYGGLDQFGRVKELVWRSEYGTPVELEHLQYGYDRAGNRTYRKNILAGGAALQDELYGYDGAQRLIASDRGTLNAGNNAISTPALSQDWTLDKTGNWSGFQQDDTADNTKDINQTRTHNKANEITAISTTLGTTWVKPVYDLAGNMTTIPKPASPNTAFTAKYDAWNRLTSLTDGATPVADYRYDGLNKRATKLVGADTRHYYYSDRWQVLEEWLNLLTTADRQFLWGIRYLDDLVRRERPSDFFFALQDANFNVTGLADWFGTVQERYNYTAYGVTQVLTPAFAARAASLYDWETTYSGYRRDGESGLSQVRFRSLHPSIGIWTTRDPIAYQGRSLNLMSYAANNPTSDVDPFGLYSPFIAVPLTRAEIDNANPGRFIKGLLSSLDAFFAALNLRAGTKQDFQKCFVIPSFPAGSVCIIGSFEVTVQRCCDAVGVVRTCSVFRAEVDIGLYGTGSLHGGTKHLGWQVGRFSPALKRWKEFPGSRKGPPIIASVSNECPPVGWIGQVCGTISAGFGTWTVGARVCGHWQRGGSGYWTTTVGTGVGHGTGVSGGGGATRVDCL